MQEQIIDHLQYPIGPFSRKEEYSDEEKDRLIHIIEEAPAKYYSLAHDLPDHLLSKTYRPGSWDVRQLIHHVADIQLLHYFRMKKAITEADQREVLLIDMNAWAQTVDAQRGPIIDSLIMLDSITKRYVLLMRSLSPAQLMLTHFHSVRKYTINQAQSIAISAWHLQHHLAHIQLALKQK